MCQVPPTPGSSSGGGFDPRPALPVSSLPVPLPVAPSQQDPVQQQLWLQQQQQLEAQHLLQQQQLQMQQMQKQIELQQQQLKQQQEAAQQQLWLQQQLAAEAQVGSAVLCWS